MSLANTSLTVPYKDVCQIKRTDGRKDRRTDERTNEKTNERTNELNMTLLIRRFASYLLKQEKMGNGKREWEHKSYSRTVTLLLYS